MAATGRLAWYVRQLVDKTAEEKSNNQLWEIYLHKVFDERTFEDFKRDAYIRAKNNYVRQNVKKHPEIIASTVDKSYKIMEMMNKK